MRHLSGIPASGVIVASMVLTLLSLDPALAAGLDFQTTSSEHAPGPAVESVTPEFPFTNHLDHPVTIVAIEPSCGCASAIVDGAGGEGRGRGEEVGGKRSGGRGQRTEVRDQKSEIRGRGSEK